MRFLSFLLAIAFFVGCSTSKVVQPDSKSSPKYSVIYVIHGDADYLYHNADGRALQADDQVLMDAQKVAREATSGEVFIFHQKPEKKILWLFPKKDRRFWYYRNGKKILEGRYSPQSDDKAFIKEERIYTQFSQADISKPEQRFFLYFGHEIPENTGGVYHYSRSDASFDTQIFADGVQSFLPQDDSTFNLTVLSTCNNGTPSMIQALSPFSQYVLASPQNLHLSHIDSDSLSILLQEDNLDTKEIAATLAENTYRRLSGFLQTAITLSVYDTRQTSVYLPTMARQYGRYIKTLSTQNLLDDNGDCAGLPFFEPKEIQQGVQTWYKPPRFGQKNTSSNHSGWSCAQQ